MNSFDHITLLVETIDKRANDVLRAGGGDDELLASLHDIMRHAFEVMSACTIDEFASYCQKYYGFYRYAYLVDKLVQDSPDGAISFPG